jgi:hypothetical protein
VVYTGSAGVGPYSFSFEVLANTDIEVYKNTTLLTLTTDYSVTINANGTGSVTLVSAATGSDNITLVGARAIERTTDFVTGGDLFANTLNDEFDSLVIFAQQISEKADRGLKAPVTDPTDVNMVLPIKASRKGKVLAFDETTGDPVNGPALDSMTTVIAQSANINTVADNIADVNTVAADIPVIDTVAGISANVTTVAGIASQVVTVASNIADIQNAEENADAAIAAKVAAEAAQSAAESARDSTLAAYDSFDDRYLGTKTSDPALDNDGNALVAGALYFNSTAGVMRLYTGSAWVAAYVSGTASSISFSPTGNVAAADVQAAIAEVDSEKLAKASNLSDLSNTATARTNLGLVIGTDVQAYDVDTAKTDVLQTYTLSQRGTVTTDNDLSFDMNVTNNFKCTPTATGALTFTNITAGQSGYVLLVNSGGYAITAAATTKVGATFLSTVSAAGTYLISYFTDGTNVYCTASGALS